MKHFKKIFVIWVERLELITKLDVAFVPPNLDVFINILWLDTKLYSVLCHFLPKRSFGCQIYLTICSCIKYNIMNINSLSITFSTPFYFHVNL